MGRDDADRQTIIALRRVAAVLMSLAALAEGAAGRSVAVRHLVLWLLRPGEALIRGHVAAITGLVDDAPVAAEWRADDGPAEALRLAASFRALAFALAVFIGDDLPEPEPAAPPTRGISARHPAPALVPSAPARLDTS